MTISENMADILLAMKFARLPASAISSARKLLLDHFCVAVVGRLTPWGRKVLSLVSQWGGAAESSVYFAGQKLPARNAAFVNGTFAHGFELDDRGGIGMHAGAVVIPAAVAMGERVGVDGQTFIAAIVSGYEVLYRLSLAMGSIGSLGHHPTGTMGPFGSAVAAGRVLGLDREQLVAALGLAGNFPTGVYEFYKGSLEKRLFAGRAAEAGVLSALLAATGITGARTIFEGEFGFCRSFSRSPNLPKLLEGLGQDFCVDRVRVKRYPCAGSIHPYIEGALALRRNNAAAFSRHENVSDVLIEGRRLDRRSQSDIPNVTAAQYSVPYAVAVTLRHGQPTMWAFSDEGVNDPGVRRLLGRTKVVGRDDYPGMGRIIVGLKDGTTLTGEVIDTERPVVDVDIPEIRRKGLDVMAPSVGVEGAEELVAALDDIVARIESATDVRQVMELIRAPISALEDPED